jgi:RND family efflux transporter MFP subunit
MKEKKKCWRQRMMTDSKIKHEATIEKVQKTPRKTRGFLQALLAFVIIILGIGVAIYFIKNKKQPERIEQNVLAPLIKVERVHVRDIPMVVQGYGTVSPTVEVDIIPEVAGKVVFIHPELKVGGLIRGDEKILQIDPRDYELAVRQAEAAVADATVLLETEQAEALVARKEWRALHPDTEPASGLVLREPQIRKAQATLESAEAQLATAKLQLERTSISLPFDIMIASESVDLGQYVVTGQPLANAYGTEAVEIEVPLEDDELAWFDAFGNSIFANSDGNSTAKTQATVIADFAGIRQSWGGFVVRTAGQVDRTSRMISVIVEVPDPFKISQGKSPLLPGIFAEVMIQGKTLQNAIAVPRDAIREGNNVWLVNNNRLHIQPLEIVRSDKDFAYVVSGIPDKANVVVSSLDVATDGMKVRTQLDDVTTNDNEVKQVDGQAGGPEEN